MGIFSKPAPNLERVEQAIEAQNKRIKELSEKLWDLEADVTRRLMGLDDRLGVSESQVRLMAEEMEERIDRGNKIWRKIRASEYYERLQEERDEDEDPDPQLYLEHGNGSQGERLPPVHRGVGHIGPSSTKAREVAQALARRIAGWE